MSDREARQLRRTARGLDRAAEELEGGGRSLARVQAEFVSYVMLSIVFVGLWGHGGTDHFFWPIFPMAGWGFALLRRWRRARDSVRDPAAVEIKAPEGTESVDAICRALRSHGRDALADGLLAGARQAVELIAFRTALGDVETQQEEARAEGEKLRQAAVDARDDEARLTYAEGAETAARRVQKLESLRGEYERASARIEAFRQTVKSLEMDVARLATRGETDEVLKALDLQARSVEAEVDAMQRTKDELRRIDSLSSR